MFGKNKLPEIVRAGHPVLREKAKRVEVNEITSPEIQGLIATMTDVLRAAPGVGLAAPQIGVNLQVILMEDREAYISRLTDDQIEDRERKPFSLITIINPKLTVVKKGKEKKASFYEGCLSVPGYLAIVDRHLEVTVEGWDEKGKPVRHQFRGWPARIAQHEVDHINGMLFIDRMDSKTFSAL